MERRPRKLLEMQLLNDVGCWLVNSCCYGRGYGIRRAIRVLLQWTAVNWPPRGGTQSHLVWPGGGGQPKARTRV